MDRPSNTVKTKKMETVGLAKRRAPSPQPTYLMPQARLQHLSNVSHAAVERPVCSWRPLILFSLLGLVLWFVVPREKLLVLKQPFELSSGNLGSSEVVSSRTQTIDSGLEIGYLIVGVQNEPDFLRTVAFSWRLKDANPGFSSRSLAFPTREKFLSWVARSHAEEVIPKQFKPVKDNFVAVFKDGKFLGASAALRTDAYASGLTMPSLTSQSSQPEGASQSSQPSSTSSVETKGESISLRSSSSNRPQVQQDTKVAVGIPPAAPKPVVSTSTMTMTHPREMMTYLPVQVTYKKKVITGYRVQEGKSFTNYKPFASVLTTSDEGWQFMYQAPLMASIILVQDQSSASTAMIRYPKALINNIGYGGQACIGGTKGTQLQCRSSKAEEDGCTYESLLIQPPQNRLWIASECHDFFENKCKADDVEGKKLWIQKPSGGQHGFGMKVHQGCDALRTEFAPLCGTATNLSASAYPSSKKKYLIMPYLQPALLDGHKFDVRSYGLIASLQPLLVFYADGFVRKATAKYSTENLRDVTAHITNSVTQDSNDDHFWDFDRLSKHLHEKHSFPPMFMSRTFRRHAMRVTEFVFQSARKWFRPRPGRFQLFACDWIVDSKGGVHLLEANSNPLVGSSGYPSLEHQFPAIWKELMDLVIAVQTSGTMMTSKLKKHSYFFRKYWWLCLNELEETEPYNSCKAFRGVENPPANLFTSPQQDLSLEEIQKSLENEERDDAQLEQEESAEQEEANGDEGEGKQQQQQQPVRPVPFVDLKLDPSTMVRDAHSLPCPLAVVVDDHRKRCTLAAGTEDETVYHIVHSAVPGPVVAIVAGVHGNEGAGVVAARHVARHWQVQRGTLVVLERANPRGVAGNLRFVPVSHDGTPFYDLNRAFPAEENSAASPKTLVREIWNLMTAIKPDLFFDLHEGRAFFAASSQAAASASSDDAGVAETTATTTTSSTDSAAAPPVAAETKILENVGSTTGGKVSKGNSIVTSLNAAELAKVVAEACNENVNDLGRKFLIMAPPIVGGLASKVQATFGSKVMLFETTLVFPLESRARQHLFMLSVALRSVGILPSEFDHRQVGGPVEGCVASRKICNAKVLWR